MTDELELPAELAPPMANGEVLFEAPWQGRAFGMARALAEAGVFSWDDFRRHLIRVIGEWDRQADGPNAAGGEYEYYQHFLEALEGVLAEVGTLDGQDLTARVAQFRSRPHDHDH
jgi:nitrile hydratase accessory protein